MTAPPLYAHQQTDIEFIKAHPRVLNFSDCGTGKTRVALEAIRARKNEGRTLIVCPKSIMQPAWGADLKRFAPELKYSLAYADNRAEAFQADTDVVIINHDGTKWLAQTIKSHIPLLNGFCQLVVDECFPAGTLISTPTGPKDIKVVKCGDEVYNSAGLSTVTRKYTHVATELVELHLSDGRTLQCTPNHPIATNAGWVAAGDTRGLSVVPETLHSPNLETTLLRTQLFKTSDARQPDTRAKSPNRTETIQRTPRATIREQRKNSERRNQTETQRRGQKTTLHPTSRGEWARRALRAISPRDTIQRLANALLHPDQTTPQFWLPQMLQSGFCVAGPQMGIGDRREIALLAKGPRQEARRLPSNVRVDHVSRIQLASPIEVYNLEIDGEPDYFANGILVHNCTAFKNASQRSTAMLSLRIFFKYRMILTGTPYTESLCDLWRQVYIADDGQRLGPSFYKYRDSVSVGKQYGNGAVVWCDKADMEPVIHEKLRDITIRHRLEDCVDIPPRETITIPTTLNKKHKALYDTLYREAILELENGAVNALNAAVLANKLLQVASGAVYTTDGHYEILDTDRYELIAELATQRPQCIIAFQWNHQKTALQKLLPQAGIIDGTVDVRTRNRLVADFQNGDCPILLIHPKAGAHGLTLTAGHDTIWASPTYSAETFIQFNHRIYRAGQTKKTRTLLIAATDTLEPLVYDKLQGKLDKAALILSLFAQPENPHHENT